VLGLGLFAVRILVRREALHIPFMVPVFMITVGSLVASINALAPRAAVLAMVQDAYLFLWFVMLVHLLRDRDLTGVQKTWMWVGNGIALYGLVLLMVTEHLSIVDMVHPKGERANGTFYDPNVFGGYLVMSLFFVMSLGSRIHPLLKWGSIALLSLAIIATKSNGSLLSLVVGLGVWFLVRSRTRRGNPLVFLAGGLLAVALATTAVWLNVGFGVGAAQLRDFQRESFLARATRSSEGRFTIWKNLQSVYAKRPLGIGPGNSSSLTVSVEDRIRQNSLQGKEAHNDYLAYAIERGPLGISGLLLMLGMAFAKLFAAAGRRRGHDGKDEALAPLIAALGGALAASAVHGLTIEVLHFRHFWMLLAVICAVEAQAKSRQAEKDATAGHRLAPSAVGVAAA
jgi:O-antigen ligase